MFPTLTVMGHGSYLMGHGSHIRWVSGSWVNSSDPLPALLCPIIHHWCTFGENQANTFQDIVVTSPQRAVSSILYPTVTLTFDLLTPNCTTFISVPLCVVDVSLWKCVKYCARYRVNNVSGRTHGRTGQNSMPPATLYVGRRHNYKLLTLSLEFGTVIHTPFDHNKRNSLSGTQLH